MCGALAVRLWGLLFQWASTEGSPDQPQAGTFLRHALAALRAVSDEEEVHLEAEGVYLPGAGALAAMTGDVRRMYFMLGLHGWTTDQRGLSKTLRLALCSPVLSSRQPAYQHARAAVAQAQLDLALLSRLHSLWEGGVPDVVLEGDDKEKEEEKAVLALAAAAGACGSGKGSSGGGGGEWRDSVNEFLTAAKNVLQHSERSFSPTSQSSDVDSDAVETTTDHALRVRVFAKATAAVIATAAAGRVAVGASAYVHPPCPFFVAFRAWISLLAGKLSLYVQSDHATALLWARQALGLMQATQQKSSSDKSDSGVVSRKGTSNTNSSIGVSLETILARLEAVLLVADAAEQCGNLDSALAYTSEAVALTRGGVNTSAFGRLAALQVSLTLNFSLLLASYVMWSGALDISSVIVSYSITSLA